MKISKRVLSILMTMALLGSVGTSAVALEENSGENSEDVTTAVVSESNEEISAQATEAEENQPLLIASEKEKVIEQEVSAEHNEQTAEKTFGIGSLKDSVEEIGKSKIVVGDIDFNGNINCEDGVILKKYIAQILKLTPDAELAADVNNDGKITLEDCVSILRYIANGNNTSFSTSNENKDYILSVKPESITFSKSNATLNVGTATSLGMEMQPVKADKKSVLWGTSNSAVVKINSSGIITAVAPGTATVSCTAIDNSKATAVCKVTVVQPVKNVTLNCHAIKWSKGKSAHFHPTVAPSNATNAKVVYKSSNTKVATVDSNGLLTAVGAGKCTITCQSAENANIYDTCSVEIVEPVSSIKLSKSSASVKVGDTLSLTASASPSNATNKTIKWSSSNTSVAAVDKNGKVTAKAEGKATITALAADGYGAKAACTITVTPKKSKGQQIADYAAQWVGVTPYLWGGTSLVYGADCSGFVCAVYDHFGYNLWSNRTTLSNVGTSVSYSKAQPGDIVVYYGHVGIYAGNGKVTHALNSSRGTMTTDVSWGGTIKCIKRVV